MPHRRTATSGRVLGDEAKLDAPRGQAGLQPGSVPEPLVPGVPGQRATRQPPVAVVESVAGESDALGTDVVAPRGPGDLDKRGLSVYAERLRDDAVLGEP